MPWSLEAAERLLLELLRRNAAMQRGWLLRERIVEALEEEVARLAEPEGALPGGGRAATVGIPLSQPPGEAPEAARASVPSVAAACASICTRMCS